jgi:hypothetical protein
MTKKTIHIGCGAGFSGDRVDAAIAVVADLKNRTGPCYLIFETLAERTLAAAQRQRQSDPDAGHAPNLLKFLRPVLADCKAAGIRIISNFGAANPRGAAEKIARLAHQEGLTDLRIAIVEGDDLIGVMSEEELRRLPALEGLTAAAGAMLAANVYLGGAPIAEALAAGADVVVTGRCADPALVVGPAMYEFNLAADDLTALATATCAGHLVECGSQVTGGYFADPGLKDVAGLDQVGFPIAELSSDNSLVITKAAGTGGVVDRRTVKEQLLYEIHDPAAYLTPDVTLDLMQVSVSDAGADRVQVLGARGHPAPATLKATLSYDGGFLAEGELSYVGPNARARAELAITILRDRLAASGVNQPARFDLIGTISMFDGNAGDLQASGNWPVDGEYRIRGAFRTMDRAQADAFSDEITALYCCGPAGGGGLRTQVSPQIQTSSALVPRAKVAFNVSFLDA